MTGCNEVAIGRLSQELGGLLGSDARRAGRCGCDFTDPAVAVKDPAWLKDFVGGYLRIARVGIDRLPEERGGVMAIDAVHGHGEKQCGECDGGEGEGAGGGTVAPD